MVRDLHERCGERRRARVDPERIQTLGVKAMVTGGRGGGAIFGARSRLGRVTSSDEQRTNGIRAGLGHVHNTKRASGMCP